MDEMNWTLPPEIEKALVEFYTHPKPDRDFASHLEMNLRHRFEETPVIPSISRFRGNGPMKTLHLRPAFAVLLAILALLLLSGVVYAIGRLTGFIPGFGFTSGDVYVLDTPFEQNQNGITFKVENAVYDETRFWIELSVHGTLGDYTQAYILSQNGEKIQAGYGSSISSESGVWHMTYVFPALRVPNEQITLLLENIGGQTIRGTFTLRPARADEVMPILSSSILPASGEARDGLTLELDNIAMSTDRTVLQVSLQFDNPNVSLAQPWEITMKDSDGHIYPLTDITPVTMDRSTTRIYETTALHGNEHLVLNLASFPPDGNISIMMDVSANPATFTFDPGDNPQAGQVWPLDQELQVGQFAIHLISARMASPTELVFEIEPVQNLTGVMLYSPFANGASGSQPIQDGYLAADLTFAQMPKAPIEIQVRSIYYTVSEPGQVEWQAPAETVLNFPTMTPAPSPTPLAISTPESQDPRLLEVQALIQKFNQSVIQGPAWVHVVYENISENPPAGQTYPPAYYQDEEWYEIDVDGWVLRNLSTHRDSNGIVLQQAASVGTKGINLTTGDVFENSPYRLSFDTLTQDMDSALQRAQMVLREETSCDDGSRCLLITVLDKFPQPIQNPGATVAFYGHGLRVWINMESGLQVKNQSFWQLKDGGEQAAFTQRVLLMENAVVPPDEVLDILTSIVFP